MDGGHRESWGTTREALEVVRNPAHLRRTVAVALVVGTVLCAINQVDVLVHGHVGAGLVLKMLLTYAVPFCVANYGILMATRRPPSPRSRPRQAGSARSASTTSTSVSPRTVGDAKRSSE